MRSGRRYEVGGRRLRKYSDCTHTIKRNAMIIKKIMHKARNWIPGLFRCNEDINENGLSRERVPFVISY